MTDKELLVLQNELAEAIKGASENPEASVAKLMKLKEKTEGTVTKAESYIVSAMIYESIGDVWMKVKKPDKAEQSYMEMMKVSLKLYEMDKEKYDFRLGFAYYKRANFYRTMLGCAVLTPTSKTFTEHQKKMFTVAEGLYKNAIACTMRKQMPMRYVDLHANVMSELSVLYACVGDYEKAIACGKDGVKLDKAIYEKRDDKTQSFRLATRMNSLAAIYTFTKDIQLVMETIEDAIYVLEEHEEEDPIAFGAMLARNYMTLAGSYSQLEEEASKAEETYQIGLKRMIAVNEKSNNKLINDVITSYMMVGDYYKRVKKEESAKAHYCLAMKMASDLFQKTKNPIYENLMKRLQPYI